MSAASSASSLLQFLRIVGKLKTTKRTGWVKNGVNLPESIADHMYRASICAFLIHPKDADRDRCIKMALVHDLIEAIAGDITPHCGISKEEKHRLEKDALLEITEFLSEDLREEIKSLWFEYEDGKTKEAVYVKDIDKLEMIIQADEYEREDASKNLQDFFDSTHGKMHTELFKSIDFELREDRDKRINKR
jgi:putative hydrolases of HD superfamily